MAYQQCSQPGCDYAIGDPRPGTVAARMVEHFAVDHPEVRDGATAIAAERARQQSGEGYSPEHDAEHGAIQLIDAALAYTVQAQDRLSEAAGYGVGSDGPQHYWPWDTDSFRATDDELRSLVKAGALLAAAYDAAKRDRA